MNLFLRNLLWAILCPGTVTVLLPGLFFLDWHLVVFSLHWNGVLGFLLMALGACILLRCIYDFAKEGKGTLSPLDPARQLIIKGLYHYIRNPMYFSVMMILLGEAIQFKSTPLLGYAGIVFLVFNMFIRLYEEPYLRKNFGAAYDAYCKKVGRWLPKPRQNSL